MRNRQYLARDHVICNIVAMTALTEAPSDTMSINVRVSGALKRHVETITSEGNFESISEYVRDLINKDKTAQDEVAFQAVRAHLQEAFAVPQSDYKLVTIESIRALAKAQRQ